jgi:hypothetical protein
MSMTISAGSQSVHLPNIRAQSSEATPPAATAGSGPKAPLNNNRFILMALA